MGLSTQKTVISRSNKWSRRGHEWKLQVAPDFRARHVKPVARPLACPYPLPHGDGMEPERAGFAAGTIDMS
jgi:hypothetical protein